MTTVINYERDRLKDHSRVNVIIKVKRKQQENKLLEIKDYDRKYFINNLIVETKTYFL